MGGRVPRSPGRRVLLVHWNAHEAPERIARLRGEGIDAIHRRLALAPVREIRAVDPAAIVVDLGRLPSHGLAIGFAVRQSPSLRPIPLVFVGGASEKVRRVRRALPDARYCDWDEAASAVREVLEHPPTAPIAVASIMDAYSGRPLAAKLDLREDDRVWIPGAPPDFETTLGELPAGVRVLRRRRDDADVVVWFPSDGRDFARRLPAMSERFARWLWVAWRKQSAGGTTDLTQIVVRRVGLEHGLVDSKICAIDATWSGLRFSRRRR